MAQLTGNYIEFSNGLFEVLRILTNANSSDPVEKEAVQNICKLLYYTDPDPLAKPDFVDRNEVITKLKLAPSNLQKNEGCILLAPKIPIMEDHNSFLFPSFDDFTITENEEYKEAVFSISIFCPIDNWVLVNGLRPYLILNYLDILFNNRVLSGLGRLKSVGATSITINPFIVGFAAAYLVSGFDR